MPPLKSYKNATHDKNFSVKKFLKHPIVKLLDPTGITSWSDVAEDPNLKNIAQVIPGINKVSRAINFIGNIADLKHDIEEYANLGEPLYFDVINATVGPRGHIGSASELEFQRSMRKGNIRKATDEEIELWYKYANGDEDHIERVLPILGGNIGQDLKKYNTEIPHFEGGSDGIDPRLIALQYFIDKGLSPHAAAGLVGNLYRESRLQPATKNSSSGAYGIALWLGSRKKKLFSTYGKSPSFQNQLDFIWDELNDTHKTGLKYLKNSKDSTEAARNAMGFYEFSAGPEAAIREMKRWGLNGDASMSEGIRYANEILGMYNPVLLRVLTPPLKDYQGYTVEKQLPEIVVTGNMKTPVLQDAANNDPVNPDLATVRAYPELKLSGFDTTPYEFLFTPPKFKCGKDGKPHYEDGSEDERTELRNILQVYDDRSKLMPHLSLYPIPYINDKAVTLTNAGLATGAHLSTNLLDSLATHAENVGLPIKTALGLATKESTLGNPTDDESIYLLVSGETEKIFRNANAARKLRGESGLHINTGIAVDPRQLINYYNDFDPYSGTIEYALLKSKGDTSKRLLMMKNGLSYADKQAKEYLKLFPGGYKNLLDAGFEYYKNNPDAYNPGLKNYRQLVDKRGEEVWGSPEVQEWYRGYLNKKKLAEPVVRKTAKTVSNLFKYR